MVAQEHRLLFQDLILPMPAVVAAEDISNQQVALEARGVAVTAQDPQQQLKMVQPILVAVAVVANIQVANPTAREELEVLAWSLSKKQTLVTPLLLVCGICVLCINT
jgi:hypothetical protein